MNVDWVIRNVNLATMEEGAERPFAPVEDAVLAVDGARIAWLGPREAAPGFPEAREIDGEGGWLTPGLIDCHTHLVYAGDRADEFARRLRGESYEDIARRGGGILSTVRATRVADEASLLEAAEGRLACLLREGVTTVEIKSGYGLDLETELRMLRVARTLETRNPVTVRTTFLGAHALPPEYAGRSDAYVDFVCESVLPWVVEQGLADALDVYCENVGFSLAQSRHIFSAARGYGLPVKGHVEQFSDQGGARLVAEYEGLSADHLEYLSESDVPRLKEAGVIAVLLPGAFYFLRERRHPPVAALRAHGVPMAVATDLNPGSSPMASLLLAMNQACVLFGLTPEEALAGVTCRAARALGLGGRKGQLQVGLDADLVLWDVSDPAALSYAIGMNRPRRIWFRGEDVSRA